MLEAYESLLARGELRPDETQRETAVRLQRLGDELRVASPPPATPRGLRGFFVRAPDPPPPPRGVYIWGGVGRGKSMLMDLFFADAPIEPKRRVHFHAFMIEVHKRLHGLRKAESDDPMPALAKALAAESRLLCFDEFHVVNIADAMILGRLFTALLDAGTVVVATSNWPPDRLYENGLNRDRFLPFIALLQARLDVLALDGPTDYRLDRLRDLEVYLHPLDRDAAARAEAIFTALADGDSGAAETVPVGGRSLTVPQAAKGVAMIPFAELCARPLGAADYLALAARYDALILTGVPSLTPDRRNEARRFMTLVDAVYERRMVLVVTAEAPPEKLYAAGDGAFEFQRTVSRLTEMQSRDWLDRCRARTAEDAGREFMPFALTSDLI
jgi:cell division protein ZapE